MPHTLSFLVIEDDHLLAEAIKASLQQPGRQFCMARSGSEALQQISAQRFDLLILDLGLPGLGGLEVLKRLRQKDKTTPVLILTARDGVEDRVRGLDLGADDYMVKPFDTRELEARARALIRRAQPESDGQIRLGKLRLDPSAQRAWIDEQPLELSAREWQLLSLFCTRSGRILDKDSLIDALCTHGEAISANAIEVYVSRLRTRLEGSGVRLRTVRGLGYLLDVDDAAART